METPGRDALITTKLGVQARGRRTVDRERLRARLDGATEARLVLVSAPAGFGKSTLLADWLGQRRRPGRVALTRRARQRHRPVRSLSRGGDGTAGGRERRTRPAFDAQSFDPELALAGILDRLAAAGDGAVLVLDDYHVIEEPAIHRLVASLVERLPPGARLAIATRADPPLPLARLRARGELLEIRAEDLRFTAAEATALVRSTGVELARRRSRSSPTGPRAGRRRCGWPRSRCAAGRTTPTSCGGSGRATATSSTTSSRRSSPACRASPRSSSCAPRSSTACAVRSARPSPEGATARRDSRSWSARTS